MAKKPSKYSRGDPLVSFRMGRASIKRLDAAWSSFGYKDRSNFLRDFVECSLSGDLDRMGQFWGKIMGKAMEARQAALPGILDDQDKEKGGRRARAS
jgi:hypothetical protein